MQPFDTLIKVMKNDLDEHRRALAAWQDKQDEFRRRIQEMEQRIADEAAFAAQNPVAAMQYPAFADGARQAIESWHKEIARIQPAIDDAMNKVSEAFQDLKRMEISNDMKEEALRKAEATRLQNEMDEIGMTLHRRNQEGEAEEY